MPLDVTARHELDELSRLRGGDATARSRRERPEAYHDKRWSAGCHECANLKRLARCRAVRAQAKSLYQRVNATG